MRARERWEKPFFSLIGVVRRRLAAGAREYGDKSYDRPLHELVDEIRQELADVVGWSVILWEKLDRIDKLIDRLERGEGIVV